MITRALTAALGALLAYGCSCAGPHDPAGLCSGDDPPETCDVPCAEDEPCEGAFYCNGGVCTADCNPIAAVTGCDGICTPDGRCIRDDSPIDASIDARRGVCADVTVQAERVTPNVIVIVDQSSSMTASFGGSNRWDALRDSLLDEPDGLIPSLDGVVRFGLALYSAEAPSNSSDPVPGECPLVEYVAPRLNNFDAIQSVYGPADPIDETPTGASIEDVLRRFTQTPDPSTDPTIFILATDGEPDTCQQPNPQDGQPETLAAVDMAFDAGIRTFIISVGEGNISEEHLQDVANHGLGRPGGGPDAEFWEAGNDDGLRDALAAIIGGQLSCVVHLNGAIQDLEDACTGTVRLNGRVIECDDPDGWRAIDGTTIELSGEACDTLQSSPESMLEATFPCDVVLI